ncbi:MAG: MaoC family dehydratase N-terminal domain-containing protein [Dehalococcoidales bacterium]|nr:MaoC family dehydratase N-terminal domain-containing protein [Dehalococcoidales bacterium]
MLPEEVTQLIGRVGDTVVLEVEKGAIRRYADAIGDPNPLFRDEGYARRSKFGAILAPPGFFGWPDKWIAPGPFFPPLRLEVTDIIAKSGYSRGLYGAVRHDFYHPIRAGDVISATPVVKDIYEREGKAGNMVFVVIETTYIDQAGRLVAKAQETLIRR